MSRELLVLRLFGGISLGGGTAPVPPEALQRRRLAMLAVLAMSGERGASRDKVQLHLWPDSTQERGRHALDQLLYSTRRVLGQDVILSSASGLQLNPAVLCPDTWLMNDALGAKRWAEAVELYKGPLLDGFHLSDEVEFERWLDSERTRYEQAYCSALESLAREAAARGNSMDAVRWWRRRSVADPLSAPVALELMHAMVAAEDRAGAVQHARVYRQLVRAELGVEPEPAIANLARSIATPCLASAKAATAKTATVGSPGTSPGSPGTSPPSVRPPGRHMQSGVLVAALLATAAFLAFQASRQSLLSRSIVVLPTSLDTGRSSPQSGRLNPASSDGGESRAIRGTTDPEARALYLRGRNAWNRRSKPGLDSAVVLFRGATERDPTYSAAYTGLAEAYVMLGYFGFVPANAVLPKAHQAALRAIQLDPSDGEAYAALGQVLAYQHAWSEAEHAYHRGLELAPDNATLHQWYALMLAYIGRAHEAAVQTREASRLDPLSVQINNMHGMMLYYDGDITGSLQQYERTVDAEPDSAWVRQNPWVLSNFGHVAAAAGRFEQAIRLIDLALRVVPNDPRLLTDLAYVYIRAGKPDRARVAFARADTTHPHYSVYRGLLHARLGEMDEAFRWFTRVKYWPLESMVGMTNDPSYAALRAHPRYEEIRARLRIPQR